MVSVNVFSSPWQQLFCFHADVFCAVITSLLISLPLSFTAFIFTISFSCCVAILLCQQLFLSFSGYESSCLCLFYATFHTNVCKYRITCFLCLISDPLMWYETYRENVFGKLKGKLLSCDFASLSVKLIGL